jgi:hypothetical protein
MQARLNGGAAGRRWGQAPAHRGRRPSLACARRYCKAWRPQRLRIGCLGGERSGSGRARRLLCGWESRNIPTVVEVGARDEKRRIGRVRSRVRPVGVAGMAAGHNAQRGSGPNRKPALESAMTKAGSGSDGAIAAVSRVIQFSPEPTHLRPWRRGGQILNSLFPQWVGSRSFVAKTVASASRCQRSPTIEPRYRLWTSR